MENKNFEQFIKEAGKIDLSSEERSSIRQTVLNFIKENPVRSLDVVRPDASSRLVYQSRNFRGWSTIFTANLNFSSIMAILLLISVMISGGVAIGAEKSLPGDLLYPVKIGLNEEVRGWMSVSEESKADWEVKRAEKRLEEAEELAANGSLDAETREKIEANFEAHADRIKKRIEKFETKENFNAAVDVSSKFETSLKAHQKILIRLSAESEDDVKSEVRPIEARVRLKARTLTETRKNMEVRAGVESESDADEEEFETESDLELNLNGGTIRGEGRLKANIGL